jgi:hypothetical protein
MAVTRVAADLVFSLLVSTAAFGQTISPDQGYLHAGTNRAGQGGVSMIADTLSVHEGSAGSMISGPVRTLSRGSMSSGPVSELSNGPVHNTLSRAVPGIPVAAGSLGSVTKNRASPLGERISDPLHQLHPLRERLRELREQIDEQDSGVFP